MRNIIGWICAVLCAQGLFAQSGQVAITMDDLPFNSLAGTLTTAEYAEWNRKLLNHITVMNTPVAGFVTGKGAMGTGEAEARLAILKQWAANPLITPGNHTYSHPNCTELETSAAFVREILDCEFVMRQAWPELNDKPIPFRFPFNAVGADSANRAEMEAVLRQYGYQSMPFTIESSDYIFNSLYVDALKKGAYIQAQETAQAYIDHTLAVFRLYEDFCEQYYGRQIRHIYLCHANQLHADYYDKLIIALQAQGYAFISLEAALEDEVYQQTDFYYKKWGISWLYRWMEDPELRMQELRKSPDPSPEIMDAYQKL